jgi:hypothetical protein
MEMVEDYIISMKSNAKDVCHTLYRMLVTLVKMIYAVNSKIISMAMAGILKFPSLKTIYTHAIQHFY